MNLFARILSHGFALVVVALLAIGLIYRGELFPDWNLPDLAHERGDAGTSPRAGDSLTTEVEPTQTIAGESSGAATTAPETGHSTAAAIDRGTAVPATGEAAPAQTAEEASTAEQPVITGGADDTGTGARTAVTQETMEEAEAVPGTAEVQQPPSQTSLGETDSVAQEETASAAAPAETTQPDSAETANTPVPATTVSGEHAEEAAASTPAQQRAVTAKTTPYRVLEAAREAYWLRDYAAAEQKYQELIALDPDNPDGYGELGNMYFSQGDWDKASSSYYEAGTRLVAQGLLDRAQQLVEVIRGLNGSQAGDLEQQISASESAAPDTE